MVRYKTTAHHHLTFILILARTRYLIFYVHTDTRARIRVVHTHPASDTLVHLSLTKMLLADICLGKYILYYAETLRKQTDRYADRQQWVT